MLQILVLSLRKPKIIIADEPFNGLDPTFRMNLMKNLVKAKEEGKTIFISTHILNDLEKIADDITMIKEGEIIYSGRKDEDIEEKYEKLFFDPEKANNFSL
jgi:ABC-2 type transport system ATP-binding protein